MADYIAVDLGAESGRVMLATLAKNTISLEEIHRFDNTPVHQKNTLRWDVDSQFAQIKFGIAQAVRHSNDVRSIGLDT